MRFLTYLDSSRTYLHTKLQFTQNQRSNNCVHTKLEYVLNFHPGTRPSWLFRSALDSRSTQEPLPSSTGFLYSSSNLARVYQLLQSIYETHSAAVHDAPVSPVLCDKSPYRDGLHLVKRRIELRITIVRICIFLLVFSIEITQSAPSVSVVCRVSRGC